MAQAIEGGSAETKNPQPQSGGVFNQLVGTALGLVLQGSNDRRQVRMNEKLMQQQVKYGQEMGRYNQAMALQMWDKTNYLAQRQQMEKAGLNPGLMYGSAGQGGQTGPGPTMPTSSSAPAGGGEIGMGMQLGMQAALMKANIENIEANTEKTRVDTAKTAGVDTTKTATEIENIAQQTKNAKIQEAINGYLQSIAEIEQRIKSKTEQDIVTALRQANTKTAAEIRSAQTGADVAEATKNDLIKQLELKTQIDTVRLQAEKAGLIKTGAETEKIKTDIKAILNQLQLTKNEDFRQWSKLSLEERETRVKEAMLKLSEIVTTFNTGEQADLKQLTEIVNNLIPF